MHGGLVGRERELAELRDFAAGKSSARCFVLEGSAGIGKTTVWQAALDAARADGVRVLATRAADDEMRLSYSGLADLLAGIAPAALDLPEPQRVALERALLLRGGTEPPSVRAVDAGFLGAVQSLASASRVCIAVDDEQWLDAATADAVAFAARRLGGGDSVRFLVARRPNGMSKLERAVGHADVERLNLESMSIGAVRRLVHERIGPVLGRRPLRRLYEVSRGNPLFALELARAFANASAGEDVPLPATIEQVMQERLAGTTADARRALLATSVAASTTLDDAERVAGRGGVASALESELLVLEHGRPRPAHPLLAEAAKAQAPSAELQALYRDLAGIARSPEERARLLALAVDGHDAPVASLVATASANAAARSDATTAFELAEHALRLTAQDDPAWPERLLTLADRYNVAGELRRTEEVARTAIDAIPAGRHRARALLLLAGCVVDPDEVTRLLEEALLTCDDDDVRALVLGRRAVFDATELVQHIAEAEACAAEAVELAGGDSWTRQAALQALAWARALQGREVDDLVAADAETREAGGRPLHVYRAVERPAAARSIWRGELDQARAALEEALRLTTERGEEESHLAIKVALCEVECRTGDWDALAAWLDDWRLDADQAPGEGSARDRFRALLAAGRGDSETAAQLADEAIAAAITGGFGWHRLEALRARGLAQLLRGDVADAAATFGSVWEHTTAAGVRDPGAFPVGPDLTEALALHGDAEAAQAVADALAAAATEQSHPWARAAAERARGCVALVRGSTDEAAGALGRAAAMYGELGFAFDRARTLLLLGGALRRARKRRDGRAAVEQSIAAFEALGSLGWAELAREELGRFAGRRAAEGELTPTERRVAALAAAGRRNREIASELVVSVAAVEATLTRIYGKLGIRSRTELGSRI